MNEIDDLITQFYNININNNNMAFKVEYLKCIPEYDGNHTELQRFINTSESIINTFYDRQTPNNFQNAFIINSIINKLTGQAKLVANIQNVATWLELKTTLTSHFSDQRDEPCLNRDLVLLKQNNFETPQGFYDRCLQLLNTICSYIDLHEVTPEARQLKRDFYKSLTHRTFLAGLKEPLGTIIRGMRPADLNQALQYIQQEENNNYFKNYNLPKPKPVVHKPQINQRPMNNPNNFNHNNYYHNNYPNNYSQQSTSQPATFYQQRTNFPSQPIKVTPRPVTNQKFFTNQQVFGTQNQRKPNTNVFKRNTNYTPTYKPTPMSTTTRQTIQPKPYTQNRPNFIAEELFNVDDDNEAVEFEINETFENLPQKDEYTEQNFRIGPNETDQT